MIDAFHLEQTIMILDKLPDLIESYRVQYNYSQEEMASLLGMDSGTYRAFINGTSEPRMATARKTIRFLIRHQDLLHQIQEA